MIRGFVVVGVVFVLVFLFGWNLFFGYCDMLGIFVDGYMGFEIGVKCQLNGVYWVWVFIRMLGVKVDMVCWWFVDYMQIMDYYKRWYFMVYIWMDWENKVFGEIVGVSYLVYEYIGEDF